MIRLHDRVRYRRDAFEEVLRQRLVGPVERFDEVYEWVGPFLAFVETLEAEWHDICGAGLELKRRRRRRLVVDDDNDNDDGVCTVP